MSSEPVVDDRTQEELLDDLTELAEAYTDDWDPASRDNAWAILRIFSQLGADVLRRLNDVPEKHRVAFLDALDFDRRPPKAARLPLTFSVSSELDRNVTIPGGTQAIAEAGDAETQTFEVPQDEGFEATGASLTTVLGVDPETDAIVEHDELLAGNAGVDLFDGPDLQDHVLYLGSEDVLNLKAGSSVTIRVETDSDVDLFGGPVVWEYYGEDASGEEGWHTLDGPPSERHGDGEFGLEALRASVESRSTPAREDDQPTGEGHFRLTGPTVQTTVGDTESRWLRCRLTASDEDYMTTTVRSLSVSVGRTGEDGLAPDSVLSNDVPLSVDSEGDIFPFGRHPQPPATFYVAAEEAFTKRGGVVEIRLSPPENSGNGDDDSEQGEESASDGADGIGVVGGPPMVSWEYWNGDGWTRIEGLTDETDALREPGSVRFPVPEDIKQTAVSGHDNVWVRARLVSGNYGRPSFDVTAEGTRGGLDSGPVPPQFSDVAVDYERGEQPFETIRRHDEASFSENLAEESVFSPFVGLDEQKQTLYLGFDDALRNGPLTLFVPVEDVTYPRSFDPGIQWEYCKDPETGEWAKLTADDQTGGLTERGIVSLTFPEATTAFELFGRTNHWIRARVTQDEFTVRDTEQAVTDGQASEPAAERTTTPPTLDGLYPNTQWAYNTRTITDEILGSSDGSHDQSFRCAYAPVIDIEVWVDELSTLSTSEQRRLSEASPERVERERNAKGDLDSFWVRWNAVGDFLDATPNDRCYVVNRGNGTVTFGDGDRGTIPSTGTDNVRATYTTGGGSEGNVDAETVTDLKSSISLVESVSNPTAADGGADIESMDALRTRSTNRIRHRGRAVTESDYEQVAQAAFRELATVECDPTLGEEDGAVTVLIVPQAERERPVPSMELRQQVSEVLRSRAPATLVESPDAGIVVQGPSYAPVRTDVTVQSVDSKSVSLLKRTVEDRLAQYLHPLAGNDGEGWAFGTGPTVEELADVVGRVEDVTSVLEVGVTVVVNGEHRSLTASDTAPEVPRETLVCNGTHDITVTTGDRNGGL